MYVLGPYQTRWVEGWRTNLSSVRRFYFTPEEDAYATWRDDTSAMGVVAVAAFHERQRPTIATLSLGTNTLPNAANLHALKTQLLKATQCRLYPRMPLSQKRKGHISRRAKRAPDLASLNTLPPATPSSWLHRVLSVVTSSSTNGARPW